jgi:hypothetical protein
MKCEPWCRCEDEALTILHRAGAPWKFIMQWFLDIYGTRRTYRAIEVRLSRLSERAPSPAPAATPDARPLPGANP